MSDVRPTRADRGDLPAPFQATAAEAPPGIAVIVLEGEADMSAAPRFRERLDESLGSEVRAVVLDLADVGFMDSTMLRELLRAHAAVTERGGVVALAGVQSPVRRLLELTRTSELFTLADTRDAALARVGAPASD